MEASDNYIYSRNYLKNICTISIIQPQEFYQALKKNLFIDYLWISYHAPQFYSSPCLSILSLCSCTLSPQRKQNVNVIKDKKLKFQKWQEDSNGHSHSWQQWGRRNRWKQETPVDWGNIKFLGRQKASLCPTCQPHYHGFWLIIQINVWALKHKH